MSRHHMTPEGPITFSAEEEAEWNLRETAWEESSNDRLAKEARLARNAFLAETDWTQAKDIPDSISTPWAAYRQALRDIPQQAGFPATVVWPEKP